MNTKIIIALLLCLLLLGGCGWFVRKPIEPLTPTVIASKEITKASNVVFYACIAGFIVSLATMVNGSKTAFAWVIACGAGIVLSIFSEAARVAANRHPYISIVIVAVPVAWFIYSGFVGKAGFMFFHNGLRKKK